MNDNYTVLICNSNMFIPITLSMILREPDKKFLVISDTANIRDFFNGLNIHNVVYEHYVYPEKYYTIFVNPLHFVKGILKYKVNEVFYFHSDFGGVINNYILYMSKQVPVYYIKIYNAMPLPKVSIGLRYMKHMISNLLHFHMCFDLLQANKTVIPSLPSSFYKKTKSRIIQYEPDFGLIGSFIKTKMNVDTGKCNVLLLNGTAVRERFTTEEFYKKGIDNIIDAVGAERIMVKCHPRYNNFYGKESTLKRMPTSYPGNLFVNVFDVIIGIESTLVVEAAQAGKIAISLIDYIDGIDENFRKDFKEFLLDRLGGKGTIYFPRTLNEILNIISK